MQALNSSVKIAVIGAGAMGSGIAQVAAQAGHQVYLQDQQAGAAEKGKAGVAKVLQKRVDKGKMQQADLDALLSRIQPVDALEELADAGLVIEAIIENLDIKRQLFANLESICGEEVILATNTSSILVTSLGAQLKRPERLLGMHFFNPAPLMALVEVILGLATDKKLAEVVHATATAWGKKPVFATSTPGFIVNRVARPFYAESLRLMQEQAADPATLDALLREAGSFRMGPFELMDLIGHDVNYAVTESVFSAYYGDFRFQPSLIQKALVEAGRLGRKTGQGFYSYAEGAERPTAATQPQQSFTEQPVIIEGELGAASGLAERFKQAGLNVIERAGAGVLRYGEATLALTDGRMAGERLVTDGLQDLVVFDLAKDYKNATRLAIAAAKQTSTTAINDATALLQKAGLAVSLLSDAPGLVVMRTLAMLANEAADAVLQGVASAADVDLAMCAGVNYPQGPLSWSDNLGQGVIWQVLTNLQASYGEDRYRPSLLLRQYAFTGQSFSV
ncbi:3-hydroxyacyl-CoA dehydrogenase PaaH [Marinospirillum insulare]|uniref:3-hydroxyacyl-CoA dehydrogenase n=1 Tax=Marinospirillum insulare TaxID=217169 RepID=A0ABQ5ZYU7_9GAMM|nr:3-hydroxyacyl-CoA dehydrogenase PaaH [Marinospirillum insulare]GLR64532.1 3-hydroxyacyl-CoA dehydrogenase [Marinospirillum insulare]